MAITGSFTFPNTGSALLSAVADQALCHGLKRLEGRLVGARSASGSAKQTRRLELAAARSGTGDLERLRGATGSL